jgi:hypothetical protein
MYAPNPSIENPLFFDPKTAMLFGDAKASIVAVTDELNALGMPAASDTVGAAQASSWSDSIASLNVALGRIAAVAFSRSTQ